MLEMFWLTGFYFGTKRDGSIRMLDSSQVLKKTRFWIHLFFFFFFCSLFPLNSANSWIDDCMCMCVCFFKTYCY